jgi:hypothetical protein
MRLPKLALDDSCDAWIGYEYRHDLYNITKMEYLHEMADTDVISAIHAAEWWLEQYPDDEEADEMRKFVEEMKNNLSNTEQQP